MTVPLRALAATLASSKHPEVNEDAHVLFSSRGMAAVFDGIGGSAAGEVASRVGARALIAFAAAHPHASSGWTGHALMDGRKQLLAAQRETGYSDMGTTAVVAVVIGAKLEVSWCGDSRAYAITDGGEVRLLTKDHGGLFQAQARGELTETQTLTMQASLDEAESSSDAGRLGGVLARHAFQQRNRIASDLAAGPISTITIASDDLAAILLTTDGVHDNLRGTEIQRVVQATLRDAGLAALAPALVRTAYEYAHSRTGRAKPDDITAVVLPLVPGDTGRDAGEV